MYIIAGLGNPGEEYLATRHNFGFMAADALRQRWQGRTDNLEKAAFTKKSDALVALFNLERKTEVILIKPVTMMNNSGLAMKKIIRRYACPPRQLVVIHDDIDIPLGKVKISQGANAGGHKGVQSIIDHLKTNDFIRLRLGIKPKRQIEDTEIFVLKKFRANENNLVQEVINKIPEIIEILLRDGLAKAMNRYN